MEHLLNKQCNSSIYPLNIETLHKFKLIKIIIIIKQIETTVYNNNKTIIYVIYYYY
jgi:hypothetical protein